MTASFDPPQACAVLARVQSRIDAAVLQAGRERTDVSLLAVSKLLFADIVWHLIGPLQSNKTRVVAENFRWVHSVDRLKIAERLSAQRPAHLPPLNICIQVNISGESSKSGCPPDEALALMVASSELPQLSVRGLMGMPEPGIGEAATRQQFLMLAGLFSQARSRMASVDTLSIGMSDDLEIAVACGSTMVRVGTALFGARPVA